MKTEIKCAEKDTNIITTAKNERKLVAHYDTRSQNEEKGYSTNPKHQTG